MAGRRQEKLCQIMIASSGRPSLCDVQARHDKMVELVERMLDLHKQLPKAKTPHGRSGGKGTNGRLRCSG
jgi:hypothetical protein